MARPSSSTSSRDAAAPNGDGRQAPGGAGVGDPAAAGAGIFAFQLAGRAPIEADGLAWVRAMLDAEAALARAEADAGVVPPAAAEAIASTCRTLDLRPEALAADPAARGTGTPVVPLVEALIRAVADGFGEEPARYVHFGATSQDVMDTAAMLVARRSLDAILADLVAAGDLAAALADVGRGELMIGRTLLQPALPTTFGFVAAGWLSGLDRAAEELARVRSGGLAAQLGGAVGTLASLGDAGPAVLRGFARELGLAEPTMPWHAERSRVAELASALGQAAGVAGKIGLDVVLLAQAEIAEVQERGEGRGGSSAMPQKRNPVAAIAARTCAARAMHLVPALLDAMSQELQRGAGTWQGEWAELSELLAQTGSAVAWLRESLERLEPDPARMRANLQTAGAALLSERVANALIPFVGRSTAQKLVATAVARSAETGRDLAAQLAGEPAVAGHLGPSEISRLLDPATYLGSSDAFIDRAIRVHREGTAKGRVRPEAQAEAGR